MSQLQNTIYNFPKEIQGSYNVAQFSRNFIFKIKDLPEVQDPDYFYYYDLEENETLELLAYKLYNNENYWDIILAINGSDPLFDLYFSFEAVADFAKDKVAQFEANPYNRKLPLESDIQSNGQTVKENYPNFIQDYLKNLWNAEFLATNDSRRTIKVIKPYRMQDFMRVLRDNGFAKTY